MKELIHQRIQQNIDTQLQLLKDAALLEEIEKAGKVCAFSLDQKGQILLCGNGGSAADAQHIAAELTGRFLKERKGLNAEALHVNSSHITSVGNDYGYNEIYARAIEAKGATGDVLIGISTSGNSNNILQAAKKAKELGIIVIGLTGASGGKLKELCDIHIPIPSSHTPTIQESHILVGHILCEIIENTLFP